MMCGAALPLSLLGKPAMTESLLGCQGWGDDVGLKLTMHAAFVLSLITAMLICPYRCLGSVGSCAQEEPAASCCCCSHQDPASDSTGEPEPRDEESSVPAEDCQCGSCLCRGAVRGDDDLSADEVLQASQESSVFSMPVTVAVVKHEFGKADRCAGVSSVRGRALRLVIQSLQI